MGTDPWQSLDAKVYPPYSRDRNGRPWELLIDLPEGPEMGDNHEAGLFSTYEGSLPALLERTMLLVTLFGYKGALTLIDGRAEISEEAPVLGYMDFSALDATTYLTCEVLEGEFAQTAERFMGRGNIRVVTRAVDAFSRERMRREGINPEDRTPPQWEPVGDPRFANKNPHYEHETTRLEKVLEEIEAPDGTKILSYAQRKEIINRMADWIEDKTNIGGHLAANIIYSINDLGLDSGTTYGDITRIAVDKSGDRVHIEVEESESGTGVIVTVMDWPAWNEDQRKLKGLDL